jgi:hypothetical protein
MKTIKQELAESPVYIQEMHNIILQRTGIDHYVKTLEAAFAGALAVIKSKHGIDIEVLLQSHDFTFGRDGTLYGLVVGDMCLEKIGINVPPNKSTQ